MNRDLPTIEEEINRKAVDELLRLMDEKDNGKLSMAQFSSSITTLFNTVSGLVDNDLFQMISEAGMQVDINDRSFIESGVFVNKELRAMMIVRFNRLDQTANMILGNIKSKKDISIQDSISAAEAQTRVQDMIWSINKSGFKEAFK